MNVGWHLLRCTGTLLLLTALRGADISSAVSILSLVSDMSLWRRVLGGERGIRRRRIGTIWWLVVLVLKRWWIETWPFLIVIGSELSVRIFCPPTTETNLFPDVGGKILPNISSDGGHGLSALFGAVL